MTTIAYRVSNLDGVYWWEGRNLYGGSSRDFSITDGAGNWLSLNGRTPYMPRGGRKVVVEYLTTLDMPAMQWVPQAPVCTDCPGEDRTCRSCRGTGRMRPVVN